MVSHSNSSSVLDKIIMVVNRNSHSVRISIWESGTDFRHFIQFLKAKSRKAPKNIPQCFLQNSQILTLYGHASYTKQPVLLNDSRQISLQPTNKYRSLSAQENMKTWSLWVFCSFNSCKYWYKPPADIQRCRKSKRMWYHKSVLLFTTADKQSNRSVYLTDSKQ